MAKRQRNSLSAPDWLSRRLLTYAQSSELLRSAFPAIIGILLALPGLLPALSRELRAGFFALAVVAAILVWLIFAAHPDRARRVAARRYIRSLDHVRRQALIARTLSADESLFRQYVEALPGWRNDPKANEIFREVLIHEYQ